MLKKEVSPGYAGAINLEETRRLEALRLANMSSHLDDRMLIARARAFYGFLSGDGKSEDSRLQQSG